MSCLISFMVGQWVSPSEVLLEPGCGMAWWSLRVPGGEGATPCSGLGGARGPIRAADAVQSDAGGLHLAPGVHNSPVCVLDCPCQRPTFKCFCQRLATENLRGACGWCSGASLRDGWSRAKPRDLRANTETDDQTRTISGLFPNRRPFEHVWMDRITGANVARPQGACQGGCATARVAGETTRTGNVSWWRRRESTLSLGARGVARSAPAGCVPGRVRNNPRSG